MMYNKKMVFWSACLGMLLFGIALITLGSIAPDLKEKLLLNDIAAGTLFSILPLGILDRFTSCSDRLLTNTDTKS